MSLYIEGKSGKKFEIKEEDNLAKKLAMLIEVETELGRII